MIRLAAAIAFAAVLPLSPAFAEQRQQDVGATDFATYVRNLWPQAQARGITRATFDLAFTGVTPDADVIAASKKQAEYGRPVGTYVAGAVSPGRLSGGRQQLAKWADTLAVAERRYGVDRAMLVAIWGMETSYGGYYGNKDIIRSLVTLAASGYRETFCREELLHALTILQQGHIARDRMTGSWAGAMGQPQFIPSSFMRWAVDFSGDGKRDIWTNVPDVIGSIANYFRENGWQPGLPWGYEVTVPRGFDLAKSRAGFAEWSARGLRRADGGALPATGDAYLLFPTGADGPAFLVTANFEAIKRYNISDAYALAVAHLADRLRGGKPFVTPWPKDDRQMSRSDRIFLQRDLAARGFRVDNFVGQMDFVQRDAVRAMQAKAGLRPDGHPTGDLLLWLAANPP
ncbi:MAG: lytic murein transglycosylase [Pseudorhodoplanes sp.]|nr:Tn3 family transposase TnXax1 [Pseudorhodoplanes sp.]MBW7950265.1 lytic murein transglycosylase [Pseudorhodoplanes sp.]MCL4712584.1 lytic murein transglycosylase [Pseudorhodoplanes sp.]GIK79094.1 MAG: lytic transglycosylase [Alphaproteobacteria bacterium]